MGQVVGARAIARDAVMTRIASAAIDLFDQRGFGAVTMDEVAAAAGVSVRSVHRYYSAKEDLVIGDPAPTAALVEGAFVDTPREQPVWEALRAALQPFVDHATADPVQGRRVIRIVTSTESLRAHNVEKHLAWAERLIPRVAERTDVAGMTRWQVSAIVHMAISCFDVALTAWSLDPESDLGELLDETFDSAPLLLAQLTPDDPARGRRAPT